jgi:hypothetical protein
MSNSWQKFLGSIILGSLLSVEILLPMSAFSQEIPEIQGVDDVLNQSMESEFNNASLDAGQRIDEMFSPASVKADCSTKGLINFGIATAFKAITSLGGTLEGSVLGNKPPNPFPTISYDSTIDVGSCISALLDTGARYAFAKFKKRLLDRLTDDTIAWINGETDGRPKFFNQPFSQVLLDAADAAAGDALLDLGLGEICSPFRAQINLELTARRPVQEAVRCTLSQVLDNFEEFGQDFSKGNWLAYSESLKPQNNPWGATLIAKEAMQKAYQQKVSEKEVEILAGRGYTSVKKCLVWTLYAEVDGANQWKPVPNISKDLTKHPYPNQVPEVLETEKVRARSEFSGKTINNFVWRCSKETLTVPGDLLATANSNAFTKDYDYVVNTDDLTPYLNAIFDAATNRLIKRGADGLMRGTRDLFSNSGENRESSKLDPNNSRDKNFIDNSKNYEQYVDPQAGLAKDLKNLIASSTEILEKTSSSLALVLPSILASSTQFKQDLDALADCEAKRFGFNSICPATNTAKKEQDIRHQSLLNTVISLKNAQENINLFSKLNENSSAVILSAAIDRMRGIKTTLEQIGFALPIEKKNIEEKIKITDVKNQLMLCLPESQPYTCKP